jgi:hypothetical protein
MNPEKIKELENVQILSSTLLEDIINLNVNKNSEILESMVLSAEIMNVLSEGLLLIADNNNDPDMLSSWETKMASVMTRAEAEWDEGRFPDDPAKIESKFSNLENSHLLVLLKKIESQLSPE